MDLRLTGLEPSTRFQLQACGVVRTLINDPASLGYPCAVVGQARGGVLWTHLAGQRPQRVPARAGYVIPPHLPVRSWSEGRQLSYIRWAHVRYTLIGAVDLFQLIDVPVFLPPKAGDEMGAINEEQVAILEGSDPYGMAAVARRQELGFRLLGIILKHARQKAGAAALLSGQARIQPALDYMLAHLDEPVSRTRLAQSVHLSESRFHDVFQQATGKTAFDYLRQLRIQRAQELLLNSDASIAEIGRRCGFPDQFHFSRQFKIVCGQSPRQYRSLAAKARLP